MRMAANSDETGAQRDERIIGAFVSGRRLLRAGMSGMTPDQVLQVIQPIMCGFVKEVPVVMAEAAGDDAGDDATYALLPECIDICVVKLLALKVQVLAAARLPKPPAVIDP